MATSPPFTRVRRTPTMQIDSTPLLVYGSDNASFVDGIWVCNTNNKDIFVNFTTLDERDLVTTSAQLMNYVALKPYESKELLFHDMLNMEPGDLIYGYTTYSGDTFDCHVNYRQLNEDLPTVRPFTRVRRTATAQIDSTPLIVYGSEESSFIDDIWVCNTNNKDIFISFKTLDERNLTAESHQLMNNIVLSPYESKGLLKGSIINMEPGDLMYGYTTYDNDTFDCHVNYRELNEVLD